MRILDDRFLDCITITREKDGRLEVGCRLGLWSVCGADADRVMAEARHYWIQYFLDGEYHKLGIYPPAP